MADPKWGDEFQLAVLHLAAFGPLLREVPGVFSAEWFGGLEGSRSRAPRVRLAKLIEDFSKEYDTPPGVPVLEEQIRHLSKGMPEGEHGLLEKEWERVHSYSVSSPEAIIKEVRHWAKRQAYLRATLDIATLVEKGDRGFDLEVRKLIEKAQQVGSPPAHPIPLLATVEERVKEWTLGHVTMGAIPTGLAPIDEVLGGGVAPGEVFYFMAPPKGGKTTFLLHVALAAVRRRYNVLFCSFEMPFKAMANRADRRLAQATKYELWGEPERLSRAVTAYRAAGAGEFFLWSGVAQRNGVRDATEALRSVTNLGYHIDLVCMDHLPYMVPQRAKEEEMRHRLHAVSIEISNFAREHNLAVWSATLVNRAGVSKKIITMKDIAEAFQVVAVANGMIAICSPKNLVDAGLRSLYLAAVRESEMDRMVGLYRFDGARMKVAATTEPWPEDDSEDNKT